MTFTTRGMATALALVCVAAPATAFASAESGAINAVYERLKASRAAADIAGMSANFAADAVLIDARPGAPISGSELAARLAPQVERLRQEQVRIETQYRIQRRSVTGNIAVDAGYMRMAMLRPGAEPAVRYSRFMTTLRRGEDGRWSIIGDASMPAKAEEWSALARSDGLHFDL